MSLLSYNEICALIEKGVIQGADLKSVNSASLDIHLGNSFIFETLNCPTTVISLNARDTFKGYEITIPDKDTVILQPGEFCLAQSREVFNLPCNISCEYKLKSSMARIGLDHLNAGWCDAGWNGSVLTLELINLLKNHSIALHPGDAIGQMIFFAHGEVPEDKSYATRGRYNGDKSVTSTKVSKPVTEITEITEITDNNYKCKEEEEPRARHLVIYHKNCLDGFGAAFVAWKRFGDKAEYVALDYHERQEFMNRGEDYFKYRNIYVIDFSFSTSDMGRLIRTCDKFVWLDHHKTAFEQYLGKAKEFHTESDTNVYGEISYLTILDNSKSGAYLAWEHFYPNKPVPKFIELIDDRDRRQCKFLDTKAFCLALSQQPQDFEVWDKVVWDYMHLVTRGEIIDEYFTAQLNRAIDATKEYCTILGKEGLCCNLPPMFASEAGNILARESGTFGATWFKDKTGNIKWSLRSIGDYDVSIIAKQFKGGGHKNAAGFILKPDSGGTEAGVKLWHI